MRRVIAALIVVGLAVGVVLLWPRETTDDTPATLAGPSTTITSTSTSVPPPSTTTAAPDSTTSTADSHVVETVEEAETILRELWFGWFEGIYNQNEDRIREVVATEQMLTSGLNAFGRLEFDEAPSRSAMQFDELEILESTSDCLAVWSVTRQEFLTTSAERPGVEILRYIEDSWRFAGSWRFRDDLWEEDCEAELLPLPSS